MGSTEPANNGTNGAGPSSCGLVTSLFPANGCRGRAEAFARRLHRRLTSLDDTEGSKLPGDTKITETSWLQSKRKLIKSGDQQQVLQCQPKNTDDLDLFYDVVANPHDDNNLENSSDKILTENPLNNYSDNLKIKHFIDGHCTKVKISPDIDATERKNSLDNGEIFYDVDSSPENNKIETLEENNPKTFPPDECLCDEVNNKSECQRLCENCENNIDELLEKINVENEENLNNVSNLLEENSTGQNENSFSKNKHLLSKSFSDSILIPGSSSKLNVLLIEDSDDNESNCHIKNGDNYCNGDISQVNDSPRVSQYKNQSDKVNNDDVNLHVDDVQRLLRKLSCSPRESFDKNCEEKLKEIEEREEEEDDDDCDDEKPRRLRRCSSLKTGKTPPGTPGRKKIVRFADVLGLDLADVRTFLDEIPKIPNSAYSDLIYDDFFQKDSSPILYGSSPTMTINNNIHINNNNLLKLNCNNGSSIGVNDKILLPLFQQPGGMSNFLDIVRDNQVCLENIVVQDPIIMCIVGTVRVRNLDFHKSVYIRYTLDGWKNYSDLQAIYIDGSCDGFSDKFKFKIYCHTLKVGSCLEFAVRFQSKGIQYWDNNNGANYCFQCLSSTQITPSYQLPRQTTSTAGSTTTSSGHRDWSPAFY